MLTTGDESKDTVYWLPIEKKDMYLVESCIQNSLRAWLLPKDRKTLEKIQEVIRLVKESKL